MRISTQIRRKCNPNILENVIVCLDDLKVVFLQTDSSPSEGCRVRVYVYSDPSQSGTPDAPDTPWGNWDFERIFFATPAQLPIVDNRLSGSGNFKASLRVLVAANVDTHNEEVLPGGTVAVHVDLDDDAPS